MIQVRSADKRGRTDWGWLDSRHTFSFGDYHDPAHMGFRTLRVINDDRVKAGAGFGTHGASAQVLNGTRDRLANGVADVIACEARERPAYSLICPSEVKEMLVDTWARERAQGVQSHAPTPARGRARSAVLRTAVRRREAAPGEARYG